MKNKYFAIVEEVAKLFPGSTVKEGGSDCVLSGTIIINKETNFGIHFYQQHNETRLKISGTWPSLNYKDLNGKDSYEEYRPYSGEYPASITVAVDRAPEAIAKAIKNRYLTEYTEAFNQCLIRKQNALEFWEKAHESKNLLDKIGQVAGVDTRISGNNVKLEFYSIPAAIAVELINKYKELCPHVKVD